MPAPSVIESQLVFDVPDPDRAWRQVWLDCDEAVAGPRRFRRTTSGWRLRLPRPDLARLEYRLALTDGAGETHVVCDPDNPERVQTAFGERSVALLPGYARPAWMNVPAPAGTSTRRTVETPVGEIPVEVWSPADLPDDTAAPWLLVHDGPEYARLAALDCYAAAAVHTGSVPAFRMALLQPVHRDEWYSANPAYLDADLAVLDRLAEDWASRGPAVVLGSSLGGLTALLLALRAPDRFGGVLAQSGSFFTADLDPQESSYPHFDRITAAVARPVPPAAGSPMLVGLTCGAREENHANNASMAARLAEAGHHVRFETVPDLHNYTAWRDALHPVLTDLLRTCWIRQG